MINTEKLFKKISPYKLAKEMKIPVTTVYSWKKENRKIPAWREKDVEDACFRMGIFINDCKG
ncbi:MAG: hypothetical protein J6M62_10305 [Selenomonadaceae bacterium]|nr:hypothetical protein [Selenomonadaceae bacterium]